MGIGILTVNGSVVDYANGVNVANTVFLQSNTTQLQVLAGIAAQSGAVLEDGNPRPLEKIGAGTLIVNSLNNSGATTVSEGTLQGGAELAFSSRAATTRYRPARRWTSAASTSGSTHWPAPAP